MFGGILTSAWGWRAIFWFLAVVAGVMLLAFTFLFQDTFRRERSLTYQSVLKKKLRNAQAPSDSKRQVRESDDVNNLNADVEKEFRIHALRKAQDSFELSVSDIDPITPLIQVVRRRNNFLVLLSSGKNCPFTPSNGLGQYLPAALSRSTFCLRFPRVVHDFSDSGRILWVQAPKDWSCHPFIWRRYVFSIL